LAEELKKTPLHEYYEEQDLKLIDFGGWALPVQYTKLQDEHDAVRERVGIFDVSHMGEIFIRGENAEEWINGIISNNITTIEPNQAQYTTILNEDAGILDDLIFFKLSENEYLATPNAANTEKICNWLNEHNKENKVELDNQTMNYSLVAIQGPKAEATLEKLTDADLPSIESYHFSQNEKIAGTEGNIISRTGYTGEDGFEIYIKWDDLETIWKALLEAGEEFSILECGLGSRDTLRLEAGLALYGNDLSEDLNPLEAGVGFAVKADKETPFIGQEKIKEIKSKGKTPYFSRGFELTGKGIARQGDKIFDQDGNEVGEVTSGTKSPTFGKSIGFALVDREDAKNGTEVVFQVRKRQIDGVICKKDWLRR